MVGQDQRVYPRTPLQVRIRLTTRDGHRFDATTWNISEGGAFIELSPVEKRHFAIGSKVITQVQGLPTPAPVVEMRVVRHSPNGIGLRFEPGSGADIQGQGFE